MTFTTRLLALTCTITMTATFPAQAQLIASPETLAKKAFERSSADDLVKDRQREQQRDKLLKDEKNAAKNGSLSADAMREGERNDAALQAWDIFTEGCLRHSANLSEWATQFNILESAKFIKPEALAGMGKTLGYPAHDRTLAAWSLKNSQTMLLQHDREGCTVSLNEFIPLSRLGGMVKELAQNIEEGTKTATTLDKKSGTGGQYMLLIKSAPKSSKNKDGSRPRTQNLYMLFVTSPESNNQVRTVMHSFLSSEDFKL